MRIFMQREQLSKQECPKCKFNAHQLGATKCIICNSELINATIASSTKFQQSKRKQKTKNVPIISNKEPVIGSKEYLKSFIDPKEYFGSFNKKGWIPNWLFTFTKKLFFPSKVSRKSLKLLWEKWLSLLGIGLIGLAIVLWVNHLYLERDFSIKRSVPEGLFDYGGEAFASSIIDSGIEQEIEQAYPKFQLRYTRSYNAINAIQRLIMGELSFAYNSRPLMESEYQEAQIRGYSLKQFPVGIDGIAVYGNPNLPLKKIKMEEIEKIFRGEVTNWKELGAGKDLPISLIIIEDEKYYLPIMKEQKR